MAATLLPGVALAHPSADLKSRISPGKIHYERPGKEDDFQAALGIVLNRMMQSYATVVKEPVRIDILNMSVPAVRSFFQGANSMRSGSFDPHTVLAVNFDANAKINGKPTAACMVQYNSDRRMDLLAGYERSGVFNKQEILYYLAAHEFGHCMVFHQARIGRAAPVSPKLHELIADKVAIAFFLTNGNVLSAERVIKFNRLLDKGGLHSHPDELEKYFAALKQHLAGKDVRQEVASMVDLYRLAVDFPSY